MKDIVIISGGANGLGLELVKQLIAKEYTICNIDFDKEKMSELDKEFESNYISFVGDISNDTFIKQIVLEISKLGNIKALINNAGEPSFKLPTDYTKADIDMCFKGLQGMILLTTEVLKVVDEENVKIINVISSAGLRGNKQESVYCATKWGERGYTESLKVAYKGTSVKVMGIYPGGINTDFYKNSRDYVSLEKQQTFMNAKDVANVIINNAFSETNLTVSDIILERNVRG